MKIQESMLMDAIFVVSPAIGYIPQLVTRDILFSPLISTFFIMAGVLKLFHYNAERYAPTLLLQTVFGIVLHCLLILMNKRPLGKYESKAFGNKTTMLLYRRYGLKGPVLGILCAFVLGINVLGVLYGSYGLCGGLASALEVGVNLFQLMMEREEKRSAGGKKRRSPKELYVCWIVGDIVKIWFMLRINTPMIFVGTVVAQIVIDVFLLLS